jgi:preprotein translocase subunit YajC
MISLFTTTEVSLSVFTPLAMAPASGQSPEGSLFSTLIMFALIIGIFYFLILRPQQKRQKERQKMLDAVKKGDKVVTAGGLHGTVAGMDEKTVLIQVADNVKMKFERSAVASIVRESEPESKDK